MTIWFVIACGFLALIYGGWAVRSVITASPGNERMQEIAGAIQEGAAAYLNRQYTTIGIAGVVVFFVNGIVFDFLVAFGVLIGLGRFWRIND